LLPRTRQPPASQAAGAAPASTPALCGATVRCSTEDAAASSLQGGPQVSLAQHNTGTQRPRPAPCIALTRATDRAHVPSPPCPADHVRTTYRPRHHLHHRSRPRLHTLQTAFALSPPAPTPALIPCSCTASNRILNLHQHLNLHLHSHTSGLAPTRSAPGSCTCTGSNQIGSIPIKYVCLFPIYQAFGLTSKFLIYFSSFSLYIKQQQPANLYRFGRFIFLIYVISHLLFSFSERYLCMYQS